MQSDVKMKGHLMKRTKKEDASGGSIDEIQMILLFCNSLHLNLRLRF